MDVSAESYKMNLKITRAFGEKSKSKTGRLDANTRQVLLNVFKKET